MEPYNLIISIEKTYDGKIVISRQTDEIITQYDSNVQNLRFDFLPNLNNAEIYLVFSDTNETYYPQKLGVEKKYLITNALTQCTKLFLQIYCVFDGIATHYSNTIEFDLQPSIRGIGAPVIPVPNTIEELARNGFANAIFTDQKLTFFNVSNNEIKTLDMKGMKGEKGEVGPKGEKGDSGPQGVQGIQGVKGDIGPKGAKGDKGDTGEAFKIARVALSYESMISSAGIGLNPGDMVLISSNTEDPHNAEVYVWTGVYFNFLVDMSGAKGVKGDKGDRGNTGEAGSQGAQGIQGIQGVKGEKGDKGDKGNTGENGATAILATDKADAIQRSISDPNNLYWWAD